MAVGGERQETWQDEKQGHAGDYSKARGRRRPNVLILSEKGASAIGGENAAETRCESALAATLESAGTVIGTLPQNGNCSTASSRSPTVVRLWTMRPSSAL